MGNEEGPQKRCSKCGETKPVDMFAGNGIEKDGLHKVCRACLGASHDERLKKARLRHNPNLNPNAELHRKARQINKSIRLHQSMLKIKPCRKCGEVKSIEMFSLNIRRKDGHHIYCKACEAEVITRVSKGVSKAIERVLRKQKTGYFETRECCKCGETKRINMFSQSKRQEDNSYYCKTCFTVHGRPKRAFISGKQTPHQRRRTWIIANGGSHTKAEIKALCEAQNYQCAYCKRLVKLTEDHIIHVTKGGTDYISNICMACRRCNTQKNARTPEQWVKRWYQVEQGDQEAS